MGSFVYPVWFNIESIFKCKNYFNQPINCFVQMLYKAGVGFVVFVFGFGCIINVGLFKPPPG